MAHFGILGELALLGALAVGVTLLFLAVRMPVVAGLLAAGALAGPAGFGLIDDPGRIQVLAEVGVVFLLFTIGLEFSLKRLKNIANLVLVGGSLQVMLTIGAVVLVSTALGHDLRYSVFFGFLFALSSTAIVLRSLSERSETDAPHGRFIVGVLIFQDMCVIPLTLIVPALAGQGEGPLLVSLGIALLKASAVIVGAFVAARLILPGLLARVDASRSREMFLLTVVLVCLGTAWLGALVGMSLALGAFVAGVVLADSEYADRAIGDVLPLRDVFTSLFFVSMGMMFDPQAVVENPVLVLGLFAAFVVAKGFFATLAALAMRFPARVAWLAGASLAQFGEFGFVVASEGMRVGLMTQEQLRPLLSAGILSMMFTPLVIRLAPHFMAGEAILRPLERVLGVRGMDEPLPQDAALERHVVVVGYGPAGRLLTGTLRGSGQRYIILDLNSDSVRRARKAGEPAYYGDVTSDEVRHHARLSSAAAVVLTISDPIAARRAVKLIREDAPDTKLYVRVRYLAEREEMLRLGADDVVCEETQAAFEIIARLLAYIGHDHEQVASSVQRAREVSRSGHPLRVTPPHMPKPR